MLSVIHSGGARVQCFALRRCSVSHAISAGVLKSMCLVMNKSSLASSKRNEYKELKEFFKTKEIDDDGYFIRKGVYTQKDFENSTYSQYMKQLDKEKARLVEEKLQVLAELCGFSVADLRKRLETKVNARIDAVKTKTSHIESVLNDFNTQLSLPEQNPVDFVGEIVNSLTNFKGDIESSPVFNYIRQLDIKFANLVKNLVENDSPQEKDVEELYEYIENGGEIGEMTKPELTKLIGMIYEKYEGDEKVDQSLESDTKSSESPNSQLLVSIFDNLNSFATVKDAPLYRFLEKVDNSFIKLLSEYLAVDSSDEAELRKQYDQIVTYVNNKESTLYKALEDPTSTACLEFHEIVSAPKPIDLMEIYEGLEAYKDYFSSELFLKMEKIDSTFTELLKELENVADDLQAETKNQEIDKYLDNTTTAIYKAMNEVQSDEYKELRAAIDDENRKAENMISLSGIIERLINKGASSDEFNVIERIDGNFADVVKPLLVKEGEGNALEAAKRVEEAASDPESAIFEAIHEQDSPAHKVLEETFKNKEEALEASPAVGSSSSTSAVDRDVQKFVEEDQMSLPKDVQSMNRMYDLTISAIDELKSDLEHNTFEPIGHNVSEQVSKLLGFQPSEAQVDEVEALKGKPLPVHKDEVLDLCVNLIMKGGKKDQARKYVNRALYLIYLQTRTNPVELLKKALDTAAPLVITKTVKTGFAKNYIVPVPLTARQRNRMAFLWILDSSDSRASNDFSVRLAEEIINVYKGNSKILEKRVLSHKLAIANRSYLRI
ncbi:hypothetical protein FOA43_002312 [Brettanomyces nanus]|uniref:Small ribosomal subunit protein uS7m n=1 Tax=Eeniella nana TaxID=13502 RepID=A0A875S224_EENNA|nr:uncharacterized protein FOA43_002312 [Brettanomyces nanus]QPG74973.1 hypothetical protein FOA43_002312 [Brettanomyces nanus]